VDHNLHLDDIKDFLLVNYLIKMENQLQFQIQLTQPSNVCFLGLVYLVAQEVGKIWFSPSLLASPQFLDREMPFFSRFVLIFFAGKLVLMKYLGVWLLSEGSCVLIGIGFDSYDEKGNANWTGLSNVEPYLFETTTNLDGIIRSFNINTNDWVKRYVMKRILRAGGSKEMSKLGALFFLAIWHGFAMGYFLAFFLEFFMMEAELKLQEMCAPFVAKYTQLYGNAFMYPFNFFALILRNFGLSYGVLAFELKNFHNAIYGYLSIYFIPHFVIALIFVVSMLKKKKKKKLEMKKKE